MSVNRFIRFVSANLIGKKIERCYLHPETRCIRIVFSDHTAVELGASVDPNTPPVNGQYICWPTITSAENEA